MCITRALGTSALLRCGVCEAHARTDAKGCLVSLRVWLAHARTGVRATWCRFALGLCVAHE